MMSSEDEARHLSTKEQVEEALVRLILAARAEYLAAGANALKHWDQIQDRLRAAARTSSAVGQFVTAFSRGLQLSAPGGARAAATERLAEAVEEYPRWLELVEEEHAFLLAAARLRSDQRREEKKEAQSGIDF